MSRAVSVLRFASAYGVGVWVRGWVFVYLGVYFGLLFFNGSLEGRARKQKNLLRPPVSLRLALYGIRGSKARTLAKYASLSKEFVVHPDPACSGISTSFHLLLPFARHGSLEG